MAATTAIVAGAAISAAASAASAGYSMSQSGSGGSGEKPRYGQGPEDPQDEALKNYSYRLQMANLGTETPSFKDYLASGGDPTKARMDIQYPGLKPSELAALGITGGRGESIPMTDPITGEVVMSAKQTPQQMTYLAKERQRARIARGEKPTFTWAEARVNADKRYNRLGERIEDFQGMEDRTPRQDRRLERMTERRERIGGRLGY